MASSKTKPNDYDVLIVGAGPCGLALGLQLARYGVSFQIIDKKPTFSLHSLAFAVQGSTLEILSDLGVAQSLMQLGIQVKKVNTYIKGQPSFEIDFKQEVPRPFPFMLTIEQAKTERILAGALLQQGHNVSWNAELLSFTQSETGVTAEVKQDGKTGKVTASWIIGCDGENSRVREIMAVPLQGNKKTEKFVVADLALDWGMAKNEGYAFLHPSDIFTVFPLPGGLHRVVTTQDGINHEGDITIQDLVQKFQRLCPVPGSLTAPTWISAYNTKRAIAPQMRIRRAFLAGDAAHIHSPIGGQGLNTGIEDAYNLGWKLGLHINGVVDEKYLDSYEAERLAVAKAFLANTNLAMNIVLTHSKIGQLVRDIIAPLILNYPAAQRQLKRIIADTPITYHHSPIQYNEKEEGQSIAQRLKNTISGGVNIGDHAPNMNLLIPKEYKRAQLLSLLQTPKHVILVLLGEKSKEFKEHYANFSKIKTAFADLANSYFIVGEHAIDYTSFDSNLTDVFIDSDGLGHQLYQCFEPTLYLIRPDGYVSFKGVPNLESLKAFVEEHIHMDKLPLKSDAPKAKKIEVAV